MKVATFTIGGERRVGRIEAGGATIAPFDLRAEEAEEGLLGLIGRNGAAPATLSPIPIDRVTLEAPIPPPAATSSASARTTTNTPTNSRTGYDATASASACRTTRSCSPRCPRPSSGPPPPVLIDPRVSAAIDYEASSQSSSARPAAASRTADALDHVWGYTIINDVTARDLQRPLQPVARRQMPGHLLSDGALALTRDEIDGPIPPSAPSSMAKSARTQPPPTSSSTSRPSSTPFAPGSPSSPATSSPPAPRSASASASPRRAT